MLPRISIITPSYNQGQFLEETILSVLEQDYENLEYIVIDGGSRDSTLEILKRYEGKISHWISEPDHGQTEAINKGFLRATGDVVTWLNSDDAYLPNTLQTVAEYFNDPKIALVHGKTILFGDGVDEEIRGAGEPDLRVQYLAKTPFPQPSSFFRRRVLLEQGYLDDSLSLMMDYDLSVRIALNYEIKSVEEVFSRYRLHSGCKSLSPQTEHARAAARVFSKLLRSFDSTDDLVLNMRELDLYVEGEDCYQRTNHYRKDELRKAFLYFLESQSHYYYNDLDLKKTKLLTDFIKEYDSQFFQSHGLSKLFWRSKVLNKGAIKLLRTFTR